MWFGLGNMALSDNFDFFLNELKSENADKEAAAAALLLSDAKKGCEALRALPDEEKNKREHHLRMGLHNQRDRVGKHNLFQGQGDKR